MNSDQKKSESGVPDYGSSSGFTGSVPQSGMVQDKDAEGDKTSHRPPTGGGSENGSNPTSTDTATTDENPNANR